MWRSFFEGFKVPFKLYWDPAYEKILEVHSHGVQLQLDYWLQTTVFRWYWWFLLLWTIFPIWVWWKYADRARFLEVSFFGVTVSLLAGLLDTLGAYGGLWVYPYSLLPIMPAFFPIDYVVVPVVFLLVYQKYPTWKQFLIVSTNVASVLSLVFDPIMVIMNVYQPLKWHYIASIPTFVALVSFCKWLTEFIVKHTSTT